MFDEALRCLSNGTRLAIMDADALRHRDQLPADSLRLAQDVRYFVRCGQAALLQTPDDPGGPSVERAHINFGFRLSILWRIYHPDSGIRKHGTQATFTGPLLEFVEQILKLEGAAYRNGSGRFRSRLALGKSLHQYRKRAEQCAREQLDNRERLSAAENAGQ